MFLFDNDYEVPILPVKTKGKIGTPITGKQISQLGSPRHGRKYSIDEELLRIKIMPPQRTFSDSNFAGLPSHNISVPASRSAGCIETLGSSVPDDYGTPGSFS
ncbi:unnamed protein product, partial [Meganyctiphanes norvegica]